MTLPEEFAPLNACPHLGSTVDEDTRFAYPSEANLCYRLASPDRISLSYQQGYCLGENHQACPLFQGKQNALPPEARWRERVQLPGRLNLHWGWLLTALVLLLLLGLGASRRRLRSAEPDVSLVALPFTPTATFTATPQPTSTPLPASAAAGTSPTPLPTETFTPAPPTLGPGLETPFGPQRTFLVHKVGVGESLTAIAERYDTSVDVLRAINVFVPGATLWAGQTLVVMPGVSAVPPDAQPLLPVYIERETTLKALAQRYSVDAASLRRVNALGEGELIPAERWILIPQNG